MLFFFFLFQFVPTDSDFVSILKRRDLDPKTNVGARGPAVGVWSVRGQAAAGVKGSVRLSSFKEKRLNVFVVLQNESAAEEE